jgi:hypothetical protein
LTANQVFGSEHIVAKAAPVENGRHPFGTDVAVQHITDKLKKGVMLSGTSIRSATV